MNSVNETTRDRRRIETRKRILSEARRLFAETGYDRTTIRAVAAAADVDAGLVMHYFGNKEQLFALASQTDVPPVTGETAAEVTEQLLDRLRQSLVDEPVGSLAVLRSMLTHPDAAAGMRGKDQAQRETVSKAIPGEDGDLRASVISAVLIGLILGRHLVKLDPLADADPDQIVELLRPVLGSLTNADRTTADRTNADRTNADRTNADRTNADSTNADPG
jgi:AcrR family transcriptional regulator